jgi:hypothetical protein
MPKIKGYTIKDGKVIKRLPRKSVSQKIAAKKNPKRTYRKAGTQ